MDKYNININIEFEAKDFIHAEKAKGRIEKGLLPIFLRERCVSSWEIILQRNEEERLWRW